MYAARGESVRKLHDYVCDTDTKTKELDEILTILNFYSCAYLLNYIEGDSTDEQQFVECTCYFWRDHKWYPIYMTLMYD